MKINWGGGIAIFYSVFVILMVGMVIKSTYNKSHLVVENYYQKDLDYEAFRKKRQNASELKQSVKVEYLASEKNIQFSFPKEMPNISGEVLLFRPANKNQDQRHPLRLDHNAEMILPIVPPMDNGLWKVKIDWSSQGENFYSEESIIL